MKQAQIDKLKKVFGVAVKVQECAISIVETYGGGNMDKAKELLKISKAVLEHLHSEKPDLSYIQVLFTRIQGIEIEQPKPSFPEGGYTHIPNNEKLAETLLVYRNNGETILVNKDGQNKINNQKK